MCGINDIQSEFNSFSATGNVEVFANNADSGESARHELSHLESALFAFQLPEKSNTFINGEKDTPNFEHGRIYFKQFDAERVNENNFIKIYIYI